MVVLVVWMVLVVLVILVVGFRKLLFGSPGPHCLQGCLKMRWRSICESKSFSNDLGISSVCWREACRFVQLVGMASHLVVKMVRNRW